MGTDKRHDNRISHTWGIEDGIYNCAGLFVGNWRSAQREALKLCEYTKAPVNLYLADGGEWTLEAVVKP